MGKASTSIYCKFCFANIERNLIYPDTSYTARLWETERGQAVCLQPDPKGEIKNALGESFAFKEHVPNAQSVAQSLDELIRLS